MEAHSLKVRHLSLIVIAFWLVSVAAALATRSIHQSGIVQAICFVSGWGTCPRIAFTEVPVSRLWMFLGLPFVLAVYAATGDLLGFSQTVSWALIVLSLIAGGRAAMLRQMLQQRT